jgi:sec-independent protein translocase protein TatC
MIDANLVWMSRLEQVRRRLMIAGVAWLIAFAGCYAQAERIYRWLARPLQANLPKGSSLIFVNAIEPFFAYLKMSAIAALVLALPVILWQLWGLFAPLHQVGNHLFAGLFVTVAYASFLAGAFLGFTYVFPLIFQVLIQMGTSAEGVGVNAMLSMDSYLSLALTMLLAFGAVCELPLAIVLLARFGLVDHHWLRRNRKYMLIVAFAFGAVITPGPDVLSQASIAIPFLILYEVGIVGARLLGRKPASDSGPAAVP